MNELDRKGVPKDTGTNQSEDACPTKFHAERRSPGWEHPQTELRMNPSDHLEEIELRERRLDSIERVVRQGYYLVLMGAIGAGLGVSPFSAISSAWASGTTVIASAVYLAFLWWRHRRTLAALSERAALTSQRQDCALFAGPEPDALK